MDLRGTPIFLYGTLFQETLSSIVILSFTYFCLVSNSEAASDSISGPMDSRDSSYGFKRWPLLFCVHFFFQLALSSIRFLLLHTYRLVKYHITSQVVYI